MVFVGNWQTQIINEESKPCTNFPVRVKPFACTVLTVHAIYEGLTDNYKTLAFFLKV